jgi:Spy/CpxP family protein refolding chaperone
MRIKGVAAFLVVLLAAAVGLAMTAGNGTSGQQAATQGRQGPPDGRPPGPPPGPGGPGEIGRLLSDLDLTSAQLEQVKSLMQAERDSGATYRLALRDIDQQIRKAVESGAFDEATIRALAVQEASAQIELRVIGARTQAAIYTLLTAEQKAALSNMRGNEPPPPARRRGR